MLLAIIAGFGALIFLMNVDWCWGPAQGQSGGLCFETWLNRYQTLVAGTFALFAAAVAWRGVGEQVKIARLPVIAGEGYKVRALLKEAHETDAEIELAVEALVFYCEARIMERANMDLGDFAKAVDAARTQLETRWNDNGLSDEAAEALHMYVDATLGLVHKMRKLAWASGDLSERRDMLDRRARRLNGDILFYHVGEAEMSLDAEQVRLEIKGCVAPAEEHHREALNIQRAQKAASKFFFERLLKERASIGKQRADLLGLPAKPTG